MDLCVHDAGEYYNQESEQLIGTFKITPATHGAPDRVSFR